MTDRSRCEHHAYPDFLRAVRWGLNPLAANDGDADRDDDGATNAQESESGTDPANPDTDDDGLNDGGGLRLA